MPRKISKNPQLRRHANGSAYVTLNGRKVYLGPHGSEAAFHAFHRILLRWREGGMQPLRRDAIEEIIAETRGRAHGGESRRSATISRVADEFLADAKRRGLSDPHRVSMRLAMGTLTDLFGSMAADDFSPTKLKAVRERFVQQGLARVEVNRRTMLVAQAYRLAGENELVADGRKLDVVRGLRPGEGGRETDPVKPVSDEVVAATLPHLPPIVADMVRVQRATAMRPGEVCGMTFGEIDRGGNVWWFNPTNHKNARRGKAREIPIGPRAQVVLMKYSDGRPDGRAIFRPVEAVEQMRAERHAQRTTPLCCGNRPGSNGTTNPAKQPGERYSSGAYRVAVMRAAQRAGVELWRPNQLRHAAITEVDRAFGAREAQLVGGHASGRTTRGYTAVDRGRLAEVAEAVG